MPRTSTPAEDRLDVTVLIERISAEHGDPAVHDGRHRRAALPTQTPHEPPRVGRVAPGPAPRAGRGTHRPGAPRRNDPVVRRLAPLGVGALVMVVATTVAVSLNDPTDELTRAPELSAALADPPVSDAAVASTAPIATATVPDPADAHAAAGTAAGPIANERAATSSARARTSAAASAGGGGAGTQAATARGWTRVDGDEFTSGLGSRWGTYDGPGHGGNGRRTPDAVTVRDGVLVIRGDREGNTGGMAWDGGRKYGKWEVRAKFPKGDPQYHPVLLLWPSAENWPEGGEVDFAEMSSGSDDVKFFLHYGSDNSQKEASKVLDATQWHNYAVEWTPDAVIGYIDGEKWFESTDPETLPPDEMHATIQLDYFPKGGTPDPTEMYVDFVRIYE